MIVKMIIWKEITQNENCKHGLDHHIYVGNLTKCLMCRFMLKIEEAQSSLIIFKHKF